jgi:hypothetical protein
MSEKEAIYTEEYKGYTIEILPDAEPTSPREWDNAGKMVCWHNRYTLGDEQPKIPPDEWLAEHKNDIILPLYTYEHGDISMSTDNSHYPFNDRWDAGQVGFIYITRKVAVKEWGKVLCTKVVKEKAIECMKSEVSEYNDYLNGNTYGFIVEDKDGEHIDSCWGFYPEADGKDYDYCLSEARAAVDAVCKQAEEDKYEQLRRDEKNGLYAVA